MIKSKEKVTVGILSYNHEKYIAESLKSVLNLKYENLEIIISDDCSQDKTFDVVKNIIANSETSHCVILNQNDTNLGLAGNFNKTFNELATGEFLITLGGDDYLTVDYIEDALSFFNKDKKIMMIDFTSNLIISDQIVPSTPLDFNEKFFTLQDYLTTKIISYFAPGRILRRELISGFPPISVKCPTEDSVLVNRALLLGKLLRVNKNVLNYRKHQNNLSSRQNLKLLSNMSIISQYIKDSLHLYENNIITDDMLAKLLNRYRYEYEKREIHYSDLNKYKKRFLQKYLKTMYLINIKK